jgi:hypothetical protein
MKPVPRTIAVNVGERSSNFESACTSFCTLAQVRPIVCEIRIAIAPLAALEASSICTVVAGSISSVDPSKKVTTAWLRSAVCTRSPALTRSPSAATANVALPRAMEAEPSRIERIVDALAARC